MWTQSVGISTLVYEEKHVLTLIPYWCPYFYMNITVIINISYLHTFILLYPNQIATAAHHFYVYIILQHEIECQK